jgi:hypothetical protein
MSGPVLGESRSIAAAVIAAYDDTGFVVTRGVMSANGSSPVSTEIDFIYTYPCPHCRADLVSGSDGWSGWRRCPSCGLSCLPPEPEWHDVRFRRQAGAKAAQNVLEIRDRAEDNLSSTDAMTTQVIGRAVHTSPTRLIFKTGLVASVALTFIAFLDHRTTHSVVFGCLAVVFLLLVLGGPGSRPPSSVLTAKKD